MEFKDIVAKLEEAGISPRDFANDEITPWKSEYKDYKEYQKADEEHRKSLGLGEWKQVDHKGGEGQGEEYWTIYHFVDHDVYIRISGVYNSYDGTDYDGSEFEHVVPGEKMVKVWNEA